MQYRPEIDGLRAVAVLPVILFHAGLSSFAGGFVGVDIFFVISGYLITSILIADLDAGRFSLVTFYERRARRILPALFFVMLCCLPFAWMWMLPEQLDLFFKSVLAVCAFVSNILFWQKSGYFSAAAEEVPLLHTWSLAVEEQYYLLFPIFLLLCWKLGRGWVIGLILLCFCMSLGLSEWGWRNNPMANFYLAPTRVWELFAGSFVAFVPRRAWGRVGEALALLGLFAIVIAIFAYDKTLPFPSLYALLPVGGVVLVILFAQPGTGVAKLLSHRWLVAVGLISYSAYLWHQPLFAFARLRSLAEPSLGLMLGLSLLSLGLAAVSWRFVEQPFRHKGRGGLSRRHIFAFSAAGLFAFAVLGGVGSSLKGASWRFPQEVTEIMQAPLGDTSGCHNRGAPDLILRGDACRIGAEDRMPHMALIGDSHAATLVDVLDNALQQQGQSAMVVTGNWCPPLKNFATDMPGKDGCLDRMNAAYEVLALSPEIETVVLFAQWANFTLGHRWHDQRVAAYRYASTGDLEFTKATVADNPAQFSAALQGSLKILQEAGKRVILIGSVPEYEFDVPSVMAKSLAFDVDYEGLGVTDVAHYETRNAAVLSAFEETVEVYGATLINPQSTLCGQTYCQFKHSLSEPLYRDASHLNFLGAQVLYESFAPLLFDP